MTFASKMEEEPSVQIMSFDEFPTAQHIFEAFDFTCCMGAFDLDAKEFILHGQFLTHCAQRFLSFNPTTRFPYASAWRVRKYEEKGFTIGKMEFQKILMACADKPIKSWDDLKEQIGGVYGEAFDIPADQPFTMEAARAAMDTLRPAKQMPAYASANMAIVATVPVEREYFETKSADGSAVYWVRIDGDFVQLPVPPRIGKRIEPFDGGRVFKKVLRQPGGHFASSYRPSFHYRVGEIAESPAPFHLGSYKRSGCS